VYAHRQELEERCDMFFPNCKTEYRPGFTRCADCGSDLVDRLPEEPRPILGGQTSEVGLVPILQTYDQSDVLSIRMALDSEEIEYFLQGETLSGFRRSDPVVLLVRQDDVERVRTLLAGIKLNYSNQTFNTKKNR
jgi:hypothetical protein